LAELIRYLFGRLGRPLEADFADYVNTSLLKEFDNDGSGALSLSELMQLLCHAPWNTLLPEGFKTQIADLLGVQEEDMQPTALDTEPPPPQDVIAPEQAAASQPSAQPSPDQTTDQQQAPSDRPVVKPLALPTPAADAQEMLSMIEELFLSGDEDRSGDIDAPEMCRLVLEIFERLKKPIPHDFKVDLEGVVRKSMRRFDVDNSGTIDFGEFLQMLACPPWRALMPPLVRKELPKLLGLDERAPPPMPNLKPDQNAQRDASQVPTAELLAALGVQGCDASFKREGFEFVSDLVEVAFKLKTADLEELGMKKPLEIKKLLRIIRSGDPVEVVTQHLERKALSSEMSTYFKTGGKRLDKDGIIEAQRMSAPSHRPRPSLHTSAMRI